MSYTPDNQGELKARDARRQLDIGMSRPIDDLLRIVEEALGIPVLIEKFGSPKIAGVLVRQADETSFIAVNADHVAPRQRFTLAHELGHVLMGHQPRVDYVENITEGRNADPQEVEANYFAAEFLCPRDATRDWLSRNSVVDVDANAVASMAMHFGLSFPSACFRLERAGVIAAARKRLILDELKANTAGYVQRHGTMRLSDEIERLHQADRRGADAYPRTALATRHFATEALQAELIDQAEFDEIVVSPPEVPDFESWIP